MAKQEQKNRGGIAMRDTDSKHVVVDRPASSKSVSVGRHSQSSPPEPSAARKAASERALEKYNSRNWLERIADNF